MTVTVNLAIPERALAIAAHPDDVEFGCGATFAKWSAAGCVVNHLICTDGSKGTWDVHADQVALVERRRIEQAAAAERLGSTGEVIILDNVDGELESDLAQRSIVARWIRELRPQVVLGHDPWKRWRLHPDHRHAGLLAVEGIVAARDPFFFPEHGVAHHRPDVLLLFESEAPDHLEDVDGWGDAKVAALEAHVSQFETTMEIDDNDDGTQRAAFRARIFDELAEQGSLAGLEFGEAFKRIDDL